MSQEAGQQSTHPQTQRSVVPAVSLVDVLGYDPTVGNKPEIGASVSDIAAIEGIEGVSLGARGHVTVRMGVNIRGRRR